MRLRRRQPSTVQRTDPVPEQARESSPGRFRRVKRTPKWFDRFPNANKPVPVMTRGEIEAAYALREVEQARAQAEFQVALERDRAERAAGIQPVPYQTHESGSILDRVF